MNYFKSIQYDSGAMEHLCVAGPVTMNDEG
jgi:hypothetical protein